MTIQVSERDGVAVLTLTGDAMGGPDGSALHESLRSLRADGTRNAVIDLGGVERMNSSGLGMLIGALTTARNSDGDLRLANVGDRVRALLEVTQLLGTFQTFASVDEAVDSFAGARG